MKIINVEQGSPAWLAWRKTVITGTDCPAIRGSSPWSTAYKCWKKKLDLIPDQKSNDAMERGKRLEPVIRARFIDKYGISMSPVCVESSEYEFLGASLDGLSYCRRFILEIKTGGRELHSMAKQGIIPPYYMDQIQQQLLVTKADKCFYMVGHEDAEKDIVLEVLPNPDFEKAFLLQSRAFWRCVAFGEPPVLQDSDYKDMSNEPAWRSFADKYRAICAQMKDLEEEKEKYRQELLLLCGDQNCLGEGIKCMKTVTRGRIAYDDVPELKGINLDKYRKESSTAWKILVA